MIKGIYGELTANIQLNGERLKAFSLCSWTRKGCLFSILLFHIVLEVIARAVRQEKEIRYIQIGKEEVKIFLFADDMLPYIWKIPKNLQKNPNRANKHIQKCCKYKINTQNTIVFL